MKHHETLKQKPFNATISAHDEETSALGAATSALGMAISALTRSFQQYWRGVSADIGDCSDDITPQMCLRVTNHGAMGIFSRPAYSYLLKTLQGL